MPQPRGVRGGRLDRSGRLTALARGAAARLYDPDGRLIYAGHRPGGAGSAMAEAAAACGRQNAARGAAVAQQPFRLAARLLSRTLGWAPSSSPRSNISPGPAIICCAKSSTKACGRTSRQPKCAVRCRIRNPAAQNVSAISSLAFLSLSVGRRYSPTRGTARQKPPGAAPPLHRNERSLFVARLLPICYLGVRRPLRV